MHVASLVSARCSLARRAVATIARDGHLAAVRLHRGAVILDERHGKIVELEEEGATALDLVLFDRTARLPENDLEAQRVRRALRALRHELFGESTRVPEIEMEKGQTVLRRHPEPPAWRRPMLVRARPMDGALVNLGFVRVNAAALALMGSRTVVTSVTSVFATSGTTLSDVVIAGPDEIVMRTRGGEVLRPLEIWAVELGERDGLTLARLSPPRALVKLLDSSRARPSDTELSVLALCAERVPNFAVSVPRNAASLARVVSEYLRAAFP